MREQIEQLHVGQLAIVLFVILLVGLAFAAVAPVVGGRYADECMASAPGQSPSTQPTTTEVPPLPDSITDETLAEWLGRDSDRAVDLAPSARVTSCLDTGRAIANAWTVAWAVLALVVLLAVLWVWFEGRKVQAGES